MFQWWWGSKPIYLLHYGSYRCLYSCFGGTSWRCPWLSVPAGINNPVYVSGLKMESSRGWPLLGKIKDPLSIINRVSLGKILPYKCLHENMKITVPHMLSLIYVDKTLCWLRFAHVWHIYYHIYAYIYGISHKYANLHCHIYDNI